MIDPYDATGSPVPEPPGLRGDEPALEGVLALDFCNTAGGARREDRSERLTHPADWSRWARAAEALTPAEADGLDPDDARAEATLAQLRRLRAALYAVLVADLDGLRETGPAAPETLHIVGAAVAEARAALCLVPTDRGYVWRFPEATPPWQRLAWRIALSIPEVLGPGRGAPLRQCGRCSWLFLDRSRGRGRRWCSSRRCGNRARVERHYRKRTARGEDGSDAG